MQASSRTTTVAGVQNLLSKHVGLGVVAAVVLAAGIGLYVSRSGNAIQVMRFSHKAHLKDAKCKACHADYEKQAAAGMPRLEHCMDCHEGTQSKRAEDVKEEEKLAHYVERKEEIRWNRLYRIPDHSLFSHRLHVVKGRLECKTCHGPIEASETAPRRVAQAISMDWCMSCHRERHASNDCNTCHR